MVNKIYLGNKVTCDFALSTKKYIWYSTKNWMDTNCKNQEIIKTFTESECDTLNLIFLSLWPIYNVDYIKQEDILNVLDISYKCGFTHYIRYLIDNIDDCYINYLINKDIFGKLIYFLDSQKSDKKLQQILANILKKYYTMVLTNIESKKYINVYEQINNEKLSKETLILIINILKN